MLVVQELVRIQDEELGRRATLRQMGVKDSGNPLPQPLLGFIDQESENYDEKVRYEQNIERNKKAIDM